jgi:YVTN family beta-propeller protein
MSFASANGTDTAMREFGIGLSAVALALATGCSRDQKATQETKSAAPPFIYVSDETSGAVVVIDPTKVEPVATIPVGKRPRAVKLSRDGKTLYVALSGSPQAGPGVDESKLPPADRSADGIGVLDLATRKILRVLPSGQDPESFDLSLDGQTLYVSNEETAEMTAIDLVTGVIRGKVGGVGNEPEGVTVRPDGKAVYVTSERDGEVTAIDTATLAVVGQMPTGKRPRSIVFAKDGVTAFVTNEMGGTVTVLDTALQKPVGEIKLFINSPMPVGPRPMGEVLSPDGKFLYVTTGRAGSLAIIDVASRTQIKSIDGVGDRPWGVGVSSDGTRIFTANGTSHDFSITNLTTGNVDRRIHIDGNPWGVAVGAI